jgi:hypothetical protein
MKANCCDYARLLSNGENVLGARTFGRWAKPKRDEASDYYADMKSLIGLRTESAR